MVLRDLARAIGIHSVTHDNSMVPLYSVPNGPMHDHCSAVGFSLKPLVEGFHNSKRVNEIRVVFVMR